MDKVVVCFVVGGQTGGDNPGATPGNARASESPYRTEVERIGACVDGAVGPGSETATPWVQYSIRVYNRASGALLSQKTVCQNPTEPAPAPPPPPPSPGQIMQGFDEIGTLEPHLLPKPVGQDGSKGGVVQFESWGWCEPTDNPVVDITLGPWRARAEMSIVGLNWDVDGPEPFNMTTPSCGTPQAANSSGAGAPFKWTGHKKGDYILTLTAVWTGTAQYWLNGKPMGTVDMGTYQYSESAQQSLREIEVVNR